MVLTDFRLRRSAVPLLAAIALVVLLLSGCTAAQPRSVERTEEPTPEPLTASRAGGLYLDAVCPLDAAWDAADLELDRLRIAVGRGEADTEAFADAMEELADVNERAEGLLSAEGRSWPKEAAAEVDAVRKTLEADRKQALAVAELPADAAAAYVWDGAEEIAATASAARAALGLPEDPTVACAQWEERKEG